MNKIIKNKVNKQKINAVSLNLDVKDNPFFYTEEKAPNKYVHDKINIEGQLFSLWGNR